MEDGNSVSARIRGSRNRIEGVLYTRTDGTRVILREDGRWTRLSNCEGVVLREGDFSSASVKTTVSSGQTKLAPDKKKKADDTTNGIYGKLKPDIIDKNDPKVDDEITTATGEILASDKDLQIKKDEGKGIATENLATFRMERAAGGASGGNRDKAMKALEKYSESMSESLVGNLGGNVSDDLWNEEGCPNDEYWIDPVVESIPEIDDLFDPEVLIGDCEAEEVIEEAPDYVDPDFRSLGDEAYEDAVETAWRMFDSDSDDDGVRSVLLSQYEIGEDEADGIMMDALRRMAPPGEEDEVEMAFDEALDECPHPEKPLDYLCERFEIPGDDALRMIRSSSGTAETIMKFVDYTRRRLG